LKKKPPNSPYAAFVKENYEKAHTQFPDLSMTDVTKKLGEVWKALKEEPKEAYKKKVSANYLKWKEELEQIEQQRAKGKL